MKRSVGMIAAIIALGAMPLLAQQQLQLDENCVVSILNRNAVVSHEGTWLVPNVPAGFGLVRARATCVRNGVTVAGESPLFNVIANQGVDVPPILLGTTTAIPQLITVTAPMTTLTTPGATTQLIVNGVYAGNVSRNITASSTGTRYLVSNPAIAAVTPEGLVTAVTSGTAIVQAQNEGAAGLIAIQVILSADSDSDGIPDDVEIREGLDPNNPADAAEDADHDGLSNVEEFRHGTQFHNADSDGDTILDGEEVVPGADGFITNPLLADTDGDGIRDALEVRSGSDPTNPASFNLARALSRLRVAPTNFTLIVNTLIGEASVQLGVTGDLLDGTTIDLTSTSRGTNYTSSDLNVCNFGAQSGRVFAASDGPCTITALNSGFSAQASGSVRTFRPTRLSMLQMPGYANNVDVKQGFAYVAAGSAGLVVVNISDPLAPAIVATRDTPGNADDVRIAGRYAYVADGPSGLQIIDIVNPSAPVIAGSVDTPGDAMDVMVVNNLAYIADGANGLVIADVSSPSAPAILGSVRTGGTARGVDVSGNLAIVVDDSPAPALRVINVVNPAAPQLVGSVTLAGNPKDVRVAGNLAYVAAFTGGVHVVDFTAPASPVRIGGLPGSAPLGFVPRDVEVAGTFAIFAEQLFPNAVPFVDISTPSAPVLKGIIDFEPMADYAGTGIAVAGPYVYMTGENFVVTTDNGTTGNTRLFIGQYLPLQDLAGVPPQVAITAPPDGSSVIEGTQLTIRATATDDVTVSAVVFNINGQDVFTDTSAPYEYTFVAPAAGTPLAISVTAVDLGNNTTTARATVSVVPDPLTTVSGIVVDQDGVPLVGATVTTINDLSAITGPGGAFSIFNVPTVRGNLIATARFTTADGTFLTGSSSPAPPVPNGVTNVGTIVAVSAVFETNIGTFLTSCDDCTFQRTLPFPFPFGGATYTSVFVGTNGYLTFNSGDTTFTDSLFRFNDRPRIAPFFDDLFGRSTGGVYVNDQLPGRFVVTYNTVQHFSFGGSNTIQVILFSDGRIQFGYNGITALTTSTITGINPFGAATLQAVNYSETRNLDIAGSTALYEQFTSSSPFDLDGGFILFTPRTAGGYNVRTILPPPASGTLQLTGAPAGTPASLLTGITAEPSRTAQGVTIQAQNVFAKAEVEVLSSGDVKYRGNTNTDHRGVFTLRNVPPGGISVTLRHKGDIVGIASGIWQPAPGKPKTLTLEVQQPIPDTKQQEPNP